jgi:hypothetical protein
MLIPNSVQGTSLHLLAWYLKVGEEIVPKDDAFWRNMQ